MSQHVRRRVRTAAVGAVSVGLLASACGGSDDEGAAPPDTLVVYAGQAGDYQSNFNPFSPSSIEGPGTIFEPLFFYNVAAQGSMVPRLGTEYEWRRGGTELVITLQEDVTWSDGEPFTADDVKFTFDLLASGAVPNPSGFAGETTVDDATRVRVTFPDPSFMEGPQLLGRTYIVPEHLWSAIADPGADPVTEPVGTGPYVLSDFAPDAFVLAANPEYWDGEPAVTNVRYVTLSGDDTAADALDSGDIDVYTGPVPDIANVESDYDGYKAITVPMNQIVLAACSDADLGCEGPQTDPVVRQSLYIAMDREELNSLAYQNTASEISPGFALPERDAAYISAGLNNRVAPMSSNVAQAENGMEDSDYTRGEDGIFEKDGRRVSLTVSVASDQAEHITALEALAEQVRAAGIELVVQEVAPHELAQARTDGDFQLALDTLAQGPYPDPYYLYRTYFDSENTAEVGTPAGTNYARYANPAVDEAIEELSRLDPLSPERQQHYNTIQNALEQQLPYIPVLTEGTTTEFNVDKFSGWPTRVYLFAFPALWSHPDQAQIFANLVPNGE
ncbi:ABC transporter substrate-binding protein [Streptomyces avicenniae]|uniref:ABC transporter substrate-binding protein n=1 Tax=Streptomyces avicenniae TaxID=500153 RepID=UPI00069A99E6|nr:ABC transporter substrate-binding protein [Streptomyces avicenniae]